MEVFADMQDNSKYDNNEKKDDTSDEDEEEKQYLQNNSARVSTINNAKIIERSKVSRITDHYELVFF
jgi:hypothetical protein